MDKIQVSPDDYRLLSNAVTEEDGKVVGFSPDIQMDVVGELTKILALKVDAHLKAVTEEFGENAFQEIFTSCREQIASAVSLHWIDIHFGEPARSHNVARRGVGVKSLLSQHPEAEGEKLSLKIFSLANTITRFQNTLYSLTEYMAQEIESLSSQIANAEQGILEKRMQLADLKAGTKGVEKPAKRELRERLERELEVAEKQLPGEKEKLQRKRDAHLLLAPLAWSNFLASQLSKFPEGKTPDLHEAVKLMEAYVKRCVAVVQSRFKSEITYLNHSLPTNLAEQEGIFARSVFHHRATIECDFTEEVEEQARIKKERERKARRMRRAGTALTVLGLSGAGIALTNHFSGQSLPSGLELKLKLATDEDEGQKALDALKEGFKSIILTTKVPLHVYLSENDGEKVISVATPNVPEAITFFTRAEPVIRETSMRLQLHPDLESILKYKMSFTHNNGVYGVDPAFFLHVIKHDIVRPVLVVRSVDRQPIEVLMQGVFDYTPEVQEFLSGFARQKGKPDPFLYNPADSLFPSFFEDAKRALPSSSSRQVERETREQVQAKIEEALQKEPLIVLTSSRTVQNPGVNITPLYYIDYKPKPHAGLGRIPEINSAVLCFVDSAPSATMDKQEKTCVGHFSRQGSSLVVNDGNSLPLNFARLDGLMPIIRVWTNHGMLEIQTLSVEFQATEEATRLLEIEDAEDIPQE